jgi:hypothetical protein
MTMALKVIENQNHVKAVSRDFSQQVQPWQISEELRFAELEPLLEEEHGFGNLNRVGQGSFGTVYSCTKDGEKLALKILHRQLEKFKFESEYIIKVTKNS